jgi:hypothetical protein
MAQSGEKVTDGSIFVGSLPTGEEVYAMPRDAGLTKTFRRAARYIGRLNKKNKLGHNDWIIPTPAALELLYQKRNEGDLKGTFHTVGRHTPSFNSSYAMNKAYNHYLSSQSLDECETQQGHSSYPQWKNVPMIMDFADKMNFASGMNVGSRFRASPLFDYSSLRAVRIVKPASPEKKPTP